MNSDIIDAFIYSAEYLNFSEAAKALYTTQPSISRKISALEAEIGKKLFVRQHNQIYLTRAGEILYDEMLQIRFSIEKAFERVQQGDLTIVKLRIGCVNIYDYGVCLPPDVITLFAKEYPEVQISYEFNTLKNIRRMFLQDEIDIIVSFDWDLDLIPDIRITKLFESKPCFIIGNRNPLAQEIKKGNFDVKRLSNECFYVISSVESAGRLAEIQKCCQYYGFTPKDIGFCPNNRTMMEHIYQGDGVTAVDCAVSECTSPDFITIPMPEYKTVELVAAEKMKNKNLLAGEFIDFLAEYYKQTGEARA